MHFDFANLGYHEDDSDIDIDSTFEDSNLQHLGRPEYENLAEFYEGDGSISKKASAFRNFLVRPNVHAALHYEDVIAEYATANNCTTFPATEYQLFMSLRAENRMLAADSGEDKDRFSQKAVT